MVGVYTGHPRVPTINNKILLSCEGWAFEASCAAMQLILCIACARHTTSGWDELLLLH